jgi:non-ribosomal peptide synthetase component F
LLKELATLYRQIVSGDPAGLPELPFQYVDFAYWQRNWLVGEGPSEQLAYWQRQLAPPLPDVFSPLPSDDQPVLPSFSIRYRRFFELSPSMSEVARRLASNERSTLFSLLVAALQLALHYHTGELDIRLGTLAANRGLPGAERVIGLFTNVVCLRTYVDTSLPFRRLIRSAHTTIGDAIANQDLPFDFLVQSLKAVHQTTRSNLFQAIVFWRTTFSEPLPLPECETKVYQPDDRNPVVMVRNTLELKFEMEDLGTSVKGSITYNPARFKAEDIQRLVNALEFSITASETNPEIKVHEICEKLEQSRSTRTLSADPEQTEEIATAIYGLD